MSDELRAATLEPATDEDLRTTAGELIGLHHTSLADAAIRFFWAIEMPLTKWGQTLIPSELTWWLAGGMREGGVDVVVVMNRPLWNKLSAAGRRGLLDIRLSFAKKKAGGKTAMRTPDGERLLYRIERPSLGLDPEVLARNSALLSEITEIRRLHLAMTSPAQLQLELQAGAANAPAGPGIEDEVAEEGQESAPPAGGSGWASEALGAGAPGGEAGEGLPVVEYFARHSFAGGEEDQRVILAYSAADRRPENLVGIFNIPAEAAWPAEREWEGLAFDREAANVRAAREALEEEAEERKVVAIGDSRARGGAEEPKGRRRAAPPQAVA